MTTASKAKNWCVMVVMPSVYTPYGVVHVHIPNDIMRIEFFEDMGEALAVFRGWRVLFKETNQEVRIYELGRAMSHDDRQR